MKQILASLCFLLPSNVAWAGCIDEANAVRDAMIKAGPYREIENSLINGRIITRILDVVPLDRVEESVLFGNAKARYTVVIGPMVWQKDSGGEWAKPKGNQELWSSGILNEQFSIAQVNPKVECGVDAAAPGDESALLSWPERSVADQKVNVKIWVDPKTLLVKRLQKTFVDENGEVDHVAESLLIFVPKLEVNPPIP